MTVVVAGGAQAETYEGVHQLTNGRDRIDVAKEANGAVAAGNSYGEVASAGAIPPLAKSRDRSEVGNEAIATAHRRNQNVDGKAFVNSVVPSQYMSESLRFSGGRQAGM